MVRRSKSLSSCAHARSRTSHTHTRTRTRTHTQRFAAHHIGYFDMQLCPSPAISEQCFSAHRLMRAGCTDPNNRNCYRVWKTLASNEIGKSVDWLCCLSHGCVASCIQRPYTHMHVHTRMHSPARTRTDEHGHARTYARARTHAHAHTHARMCTTTPSHPATQPPWHTDSQTVRHIRILTNTGAWVVTSNGAYHGNITNSGTTVFTGTHVRAYTHTRTHTQARPYAYTHTTHPPTHTHTHQHRGMGCDEQRSLPRKHHQRGHDCVQDAVAAAHGRLVHTLRAPLALLHHKQVGACALFVSLRRFWHGGCLCGRAGAWVRCARIRRHGIGGLGGGEARICGHGERERGGGGG